jgi:hypothetical protein
VSNGDHAIASLKTECMGRINGREAPATAKLVDYNRLFAGILFVHYVAKLIIEPENRHWAVLERLVGTQR